jgi:hypothetical protein
VGAAGGRVLEALHVIVEQTGDGGPGQGAEERAQAAEALLQQTEARLTDLSAATSATQKTEQDVTLLQEQVR